ncbi:MAG TPA: ABC transporter permease, partial [Candidatus Paceibacterota bacterium]|nr:ABC transporter permease [Candidatus Paceibacterota bacterium]
MRIFGTLLRRELAAFFLSITGYVIIASVTLLTSLGYVVLIAGLAGSDPTTAPVTEIFYSTFSFWLVVLLVAPVITMRLFALEKSAGTFETLMTTPVGDFQVVAAKFAAAVIFYMVTWLPMLACLFVVRHFTNQPGALDAGTVSGMYLGIFLTGCLFLSLGCFASAISRSQMAAAMISFVLGVSLFSLGYLAMQIPV